MRACRFKCPGCPTKAGSPRDLGSLLARCRRYHCTFPLYSRGFILKCEFSNLAFRHLLGGIPGLAKNERDVGHPASSSRRFSGADRSRDVSSCGRSAHCR